MWTNATRDKARELRKTGARYEDICLEIGQRVPKGTLAHWCRGIELPEQIKAERWKKHLIHLEGARKKALKAKSDARTLMLSGLRDSIRSLLRVLDATDVSKIALAMLYLGEGGKSGGYVKFCNSKPDVISLYMRLLRRCFDIDETKLRCVVQCRADQDIPYLENFWSNVTGMPREKFRASRIDPRTVGKKTEKVSYKGVCVVDYYSAIVFNELLQVADLLCKGR